MLQFECVHCHQKTDEKDVIAKLHDAILFAETARRIGARRQHRGSGGRPKGSRCPGCSAEMSAAKLRDHRIPCVRDHLKEIQFFAIELAPKDPDPYPDFRIREIRETEVEFEKLSCNNVISVPLEKIAEITQLIRDKNRAAVRVYGNIEWHENIQRWRFVPTRPVGRPTLDRQIWRDLEARFRSLQSPDGDALRANWISTSWNDDGDHWYLSGTQNVRVHEFFKWIAERAAVELGHDGGQEAVAFWLDRLKRDSQSFHSDAEISSRELDGRITTAQAGTIYRVWEASADYCLKLETANVSAARRDLDELEPPLQIAIPSPTVIKENPRRDYVMPILDEKGWSILDWANEAGVDFHTANDYLKSKTRSFQSTRRKLASALGVDVGKLPR